MIATSELWAQERIDQLCEPYLTKYVGVEIGRQEAWMLVRAAYARGYVDAITDDPPLQPATITAVAATLRLMVPA